MPVVESDLKKRYRRMLDAQTRAADRMMAAFLPPKEVYVVNGFWRSGTTWLQQIIARGTGAKTTFEPFNQRFPDYRRSSHAIHGLKSRAGKEAFFPFFDRAENFTKAQPYLETAFRGFVNGNFALTARDSWRDAYRRKLVVKFVRASLSLKAIHTQFEVPILHVRRHPCAVVASLEDKRNDWPWNFDEVSVEDLLLTPADGRAALFEEHRDVIARCDKQGQIAKVAAYWALTEKYADAALAGEPWARIVRYEDLVGDPVSGFAEIKEFLGCSDWNTPDYFANSRLTDKNRTSVPAQRRKDDWRNRLSSAEIDTTLNIVGTLFPHYTDV